MFDRLINLVAGDVPPEQRATFVRVLFRSIFLAFIVFAFGGLSWSGLAGFAKAGEVEKVKKELTEKIDQVDRKVEGVAAAVSKSEKLQRRTAYETEIRRLDQEIFNAITRVKELQSAGLRVDRIYDERIHELQSERDRIQNRLNAFMRANPEITGETF